MRKAIVLAVCAAVVTLPLFSAQTAKAAPQDGICNSSAYLLDGRGEFCLYYSPNLGNSLYDAAANQNNDADLGDNRFISKGVGKDAIVRNNAASANNRMYGQSVWVYRSPNFTGTQVFVGSQSWVNLGVLRNDEASYRWTE